MAWKKGTIILENGDSAEAQEPEIISASRSTDIPGFYADWFFHRLKAGYSAWINPFNGKKSYVSYKRTRFIIFWSKNPRPLLSHLDELKQHEPRIECYVQYSLNDYENEGLEKGIPLLANRIDTFKRLVDKLGPGRVIWRYDPLVLTDRIGIDDLLKKIERIGDALKGYTEKLVFSFADIAVYKKVQRNLIANNIHAMEWTEDKMQDFCRQIQVLNSKWHYVLATCGEKPQFRQWGIEPNHCVDDNLMIRFAWHDKELMKVLGVEIRQRELGLFDTDSALPDGAIVLDDMHYALKRKDNRDKGQRPLCGCMVSKDIGQYNTCAHLCEYCYANTSKQTALRNLKLHKANPYAETITGL